MLQYEIGWEKGRKKNFFNSWTEWKNIESRKEEKKNFTKNQMSFCGFPKTTRCTYGAHKLKASKEKNMVICTRKKEKNYAKCEVTAVHEGNRKHFRLTVCVFLFFFFHSLSLACYPCILTVDHSFNVS